MAVGKRSITVKGRKGFQRKAATLAKHEDYKVAKRMPATVCPIWITYFGKPLKVGP